jgi:lysozyme
MNASTQKYVAFGLVGLAVYLLFVQSGKNIAARIGTEIMSVSDSGLKLIADFETVDGQFSPMPYRDANGHSVGFGHFILPTDNLTFPITEAQAYDLLNQDAAIADKAIQQYVSVPLTQNQHDALVSLVYNIGVENFHTSTLLRLLNQGDYNGAANQFPVWNKSQHQIIDALVERRASEQALFLTA